MSIYAKSLILGLLHAVLVCWIGNPVLGQETGKDLADLIDHVSYLLENEKNDSAFQIGQQIVELAQHEEDLLLAARAMIIAGRCHSSVSKHKVALTLVRQAITLLSKSRSSDTERAAAFDAMAHAWRTLNRDSCRQYIDLTLSALEGDKDSHRLWRARGLYKLSRWHKEGGSYDSLKFYIDRTIEILMEDPSIDYRTYGDALRLKAVWHEEQGDLQGAMKLYQEVAQIFAKKYPADHLIFSFVAVDFANILTYQDKSLEAKQHLIKALDIKLRSHGKFHNGTAYTYQMLGNISNQLEDYEQGIIYSREAIEINDSLYGKNNRWSANVYNNLGISYGIQGDEQQAISCYLKSIADNTKVLGPENYELPYPLLNLGDHYLEKGDLSKAETYYLESLHITDKLYGYSYRLSISTRIYLADVALKLGRLDKAMAEVKDGLQRTKYQPDQPDPFSLIEYPSILVDLFVLASEIEEQLWIASNDPIHLSEGLKYIKVGDEFIDYTRRKFSEDGSKLDFVRYTSPLYEQGVKLAFEQWQQQPTRQSLEVAWHLMEANRSLGLLETLYAEEAMSFSNIPDSVIQHAASQQQSILTLERKLISQDGLSATDETRIRLESQLATEKISFSRLIEEFEIKYPEYYHLKYQPLTLDLDKVQDIMISKDAGLLSYFLGDEQHFVMAILPDTLAIYKLDGMSISSTLPAFLQTISNNESIDQASIAQVYDLGHRLYRSIFAPISLPLPENLIVVPDAALGELSFDALLFDNATGKSPDALPFLIRAHNFSYTYSAALLRQLEGGSHDNVQTGLICFAPNFDAPTDASEPAIRSDELGPLLFNQDEAQQITKITTGKLYAGVDATRTKFEQVADQAQVLHLSSHAVANNDLGENSFLAFAPQPDGGDLLFVRDLYGMSIPVEMVVLSACKTASGEIRKGEGIVSLARGFFYAGTRSLVSTLWNLNDQAGSKLMATFYAGLKNHLRKDEALRNAKLRFLAEATDAEELHPYYWAGVICMGNTDTFNIGKSARTSHYLLWAGLALMTLFLIRKFLVSPP